MSLLRWYSARQPRRLYKLKNLYEGNENVKQAKLQSYKTLFENIKMKEEENIASYFLWVDEAVNGIRGLREDMTNSVIMTKFLRTPPHQFDSKVFAIKEAKFDKAHHERVVWISHSL